jgi:two-component sensor histidine kinase
MNTIKSLLHLQTDSLKDPIAIEALKDTQSRVQSMMVLYDKLYRSVDFNAMSIKEYLFSLIDEIVDNFPNSNSVTIQKNIGNFLVDAKKLQSVGIIINELLTNIMKYAFTNREKGLISVVACLKGTSVLISIQDDGRGIPEEITFENSEGFGLTLVRILTDQLGGTIRIVRGNGTNVILEFNI